MLVISRALFWAVCLNAGGALAQSKADPARGAVRAAACAACHGSAKTPAAPGMPYLDAQQAEFLVLQMFFIREGLRDVPQMRGMLKDFTDGDLNDVAAHYSRQPPVAAGGRADSKLQSRGEAVAKAMGCGSCHMANYEGQRQIPRITAQREDYLAATLKAYRDGQRSGSDTSMNAAMYQVSDTDIAALAHYLAHRK